MASGTSSFEVWLKPANLTQTGPAPIISVGGDSTNHNFMLGQLKERYQAQLLHTAKSSNSRARLLSTGGVLMSPHHVIHTFGHGVEHLYINGAEQLSVVAGSESLGGNFSNWDSNGLFNIGNEADSNRPYYGEIYLVAVYDHALSPSEVRQNYDFGLGSGPLVNQPPSANAGNDQTVILPTTLTLAGSVSDDGLPYLPGNVTAFWSQIDGPGTAIFSNTMSLTSTVSFDVEGIYTLRLTANDGEWIGSDNITINVQLPAVPYVINLPRDSAEAEIAAAGLIVGTVSMAYDETVLANRVISQSPAADDRVTPGSFVDLVVSNGPAPPNTAPELDPIGDHSVYENSTLNLIISATDDDGHTLTFSHDGLPGFAILEATEPGAATLKLTPGFDDSGIYQITIRVTDNGSPVRSDEERIEITVMDVAVITRVTTGLVAFYPFTEGSNTTVGDESNYGNPLNLQISGAVSWLGSGAGVNMNGGRIGTSVPASKIISALQSSNTSSFEIWALPANLVQDGPARMLSIGGDTDFQNFILGQDAAGFEVRLLHTGKDSKAHPRLTTTSGPAIAVQHVVHTYDGITERLFVDGVEHPQTVTVAGNYSNWDSTDLFNIGNEGNSERPFLGDIYLVAVYDRALDPSEVLQNYYAGPAGLAPQTPSTQSFTDLSISAGPSAFGSYDAQSLDVNGDRLSELYFTMSLEPTYRPDLFYLNRADNLFTEERRTRGIDNFDIGGHGDVGATLDNDGDLNLFSGSRDQSRIYENNGDGSYIDVTSGSGFLSRGLPTRDVIVFDMERGGDLDLFLVSNHQGNDDPTGENNDLYLNDGEPGFTAIMSGALVNSPAGQGTSAVNYGDQDIFASNRTGIVNILQNNGNGIFTQVTPTSIGITQTAQDGVSVADVNNDGWVDVLLNKHLFLSIGNGQFTHSQIFEGATNHDTGGFADLDNDGDWDLAFPGRNYIYLNDGSGNFTASHSFALGTITDPQTVAFADSDQDGDLDFFYGQKQTFNRQIRNDLNGDNRWIKIGLRPASGQIGAPGARITIYEAGGLGDPARRIIWTEVSTQQGYPAQHDPELHLGVGNNAKVDIEVFFPSNDVAVFRNITNAGTNTLHIISEDGSESPP
jgi:hypothetical protein